MGVIQREILKLLVEQQIFTTAVRGAYDTGGNDEKQGPIHGSGTGKTTLGEAGEFQRECTPEELISSAYNTFSRQESGDSSGSSQDRRVRFQLGNVFADYQPRAPPSSPERAGGSGQIVPGQNVNQYGRTFRQLKPLPPHMETISFNPPARDASQSSGRVGENSGDNI